ncbi:MAG TPA: YbbR-like domain-containing protein [Desulfobacterales bacterium]|nr:YbbR-like domain-containing protein [Desulfobacterales bacterium]
MEKLADKQIKTNYRPPKLSWRKDWLIKLISLFFAVFLWYFVAGEDRVDMNVKIPVEIVNMPRDLIISNQFKNILEVTVSGPRSLIREIARSDISRSIDLSNAKPGNMIIDNKPDSISFARGITVLRIQPSHTILLIDKLIQKNLPIKAVTKGKPPREYELKRIILTPDHINISGPQNIIDKHKILPTKPIDINGLDQEVTRQIYLNIPPEVINLIGSPSITARIIIKEKMVEKKINKLTITVIGLAKGKKAVLKPRVVELKVRIPMLVSKSTLKPRQLFTARVDVSKISASQHSAAVKITATQPRIIIEDVIPASVNVTIK